MSQGGNMRAIHQHFETPVVLSEDKINKLPHLGTPGTWEWYGMNIPDFGISEALSGGKGGTLFNNPLITKVQAADNTGQTGQTGYPIPGTFQSYPRTTPTNTIQQQPVQQQPSGGSYQDIFRNMYGPNETMPPGWNPPGTTSGPSPEELYRQQQTSSINSGWDAYLGQLNDMLNVGLPGQKTGQEQIANTSYTGGVNALGTQKTASENQVNQQQVKSLNDLGENVRNLFQSGNIYLGSRGAGDSSAANQYSYAVGKLGTQARGDILSQANQRMQQIGDIYNTEVNRLDTEKNSRIGQIADWFNSAQNAVRGQIGGAGLNKERDIQTLSTNIYNQALSAMQTLQAETANRRSTLETWAANNSKSVGELVQNLKSVGSSMPQFQGINAGMPQVTSEGNYYVPTGYGANTTEKRDLFGNIIR